MLLQNPKHLPKGFTVTLFHLFSGLGKDFIKEKKIGKNILLNFL